jgi:hypothetical protein
MRVFNDDMTEEYEADIDENGNIALLTEGDEDEDIDDNDISDEELDDLMFPIVVEAILDGRLPSSDVEFSHATQLGLELGVVVNTAQGIALSRDLESGLELSNYAKNFDKIRGFGKSLHATGMRGGAKRLMARTRGRMATAGRAAADLSNQTLGRLQSHGATVAMHTKKMYGSAKAGVTNHLAKNAGRYAAGGAFAGGAAVGIGAGRMSKNPLHADAEKRRASAGK